MHNKTSTKNELMQYFLCVGYLHANLRIQSLYVVRVALEKVENPLRKVQRSRIGILSNYWPINYRMCQIIISSVSLSGVVIQSYKSLMVVSVNFYCNDRLSVAGCGPRIYIGNILHI
jgi:hypothetical protein